MNLDQINRLLTEAMKLTNHRDFVIIGSLSALGSTQRPLPERMTMSTDVDFYPKNDPGRASEIANKFGLGSDFEQQHGYYADAVSPALPTLAEGWQTRLVRVNFENGVTAWFLDPNDAAVSKYARCEERDREWIRAGLLADILSLPTIEYRFRETIMTEPGESKRAKQALEEDRVWLAEQQTGLGSSETPSEYTPEDDAPSPAN